MPFPGPGTAAASGSGQRVYRVCTVVSLLCLTYVRGPGLKAGTGRPFDDAVTFSYFGVSKQNKKRLVGFQQVWNHEDASKPEIQQNAECKLKDYSVVEHDLPILI